MRAWGTRCCWRCMPAAYPPCLSRSGRDSYSLQRRRAALVRARVRARFRARVRVRIKIRVSVRVRVRVRVRFRVRIAPTGLGYNSV